MIEIRKFNSTIIINRIYQTYRGNGYAVERSLYSDLDTEHEYLCSNNLDELKEFLIKFQNGVPFIKIKDTDKLIAFNDSSFPSLQLGRVKELYPDIPFKRVIQKDKADVIVTDNVSFDVQHYFKDRVKAVILYNDPYGENIAICSHTIGGSKWDHGKFKFHPNDENAVKPYFDHIIASKNLNNYKILYMIEIKSNKKYKDRIENITFNNYITTEEFVKNLWKYIPEITEEEWNNIKDLIHSKNIDELKLGAQLLSTTNFKKKLCDIAYLVNDKWGESSASLDYIKYLIKYDSSYKWRTNSSTSESCYRRTLASGIYDDEEKEIKSYSQLLTIIDNIKENFKELEKLNVYVTWRRNDKRIEPIE